MNSKSTTQTFIPAERIERTILLIRGQKVILDADLAELYGVQTGALNRAVKRNRERFPEDFMFQLAKEEYDNLKCHFGISRSWGGRRRSFPYAFTEHGAIMAASVLNTERAVKVEMIPRTLHVSADFGGETGGSRRLRPPLPSQRQDGTQ